MDRAARLFPYIATILVGLVHAIAWRAATPLTTWMIIATAWALLCVVSLLLLRREEMLRETFLIVPGDISRGIGGAAFGVMLVALVGFAAVRLTPTRTFEELRTLIFVATAVKVELYRALAIVALATCEEVIFRGAVAVFLEERFGSARAPWVASGLYVLAALPSLRPSVIIAAIAIGGVTAFFVGKYRRLLIAIVAHAAFAWLAVEFVLPTLWQNLLRPH